MNTQFKRTKIFSAMTVFISSYSAVVFADDVVLKPVEIRIQREAGEASPGKVSLDAVQPQSLITRDFIIENAAAGANYADIVNLTPSVLSIDPNGPGMMESQSLTLRGFQDGQYNVTFDGIPWGDSNDFTHHSTVYFMPQDMEDIIVDRGPGDASTFGNANFGGSIGMTSKNLSDSASSSAFMSLGSWNTQLLGVQHESGLTGDNKDSKYYFSVKESGSDGFLTNSGQQRQNLFAKFEKQVSVDTTLSAVAMYNHTRQNTPYGSTLAQQDQYGYNLGLIKSSQSESNADWNYDELRTDFEYIGLKTRQGEWNIDNKLYTYAYYHYGYYGLNPGSVSFADTQTDGGTANGANNVPGGQMHNNYRSVGDMFNADRNLGPGKLQLGFWFDRQDDSRFEQQIDWTLGAAPNPGGGTISNGVDRDQQNTLITIQSYAKYDWNVTKDWLLDFGGREVSFTRGMDANVNQKTLAPYSGSATWTKFLPSVNARYAVSPSASLYAQYAEGFLAPNLNVFYRSGVDLGSVKPTTTKNFQVGGNWSNQDFNGGIAVYHIESTNLSTAVTCPAGAGACYNVVPGVTFDGYELEGSRNLGHGFSLYANFAQNDYNTQGAGPLQNTPKQNAALGLIYKAGPWYASITDKVVSDRVSGVDANGKDLNLPGYSIANMDVRYQVQDSGNFVPKGSKISFKVNNLFDRSGPMASLYSSTVTNEPVYFVIPSRSFQVGLEVPF